MNRWRFAERFPDLFVAVGLWFDEFARTTGAQVQALLGAQSYSPPGRERENRLLG